MKKIMKLLLFLIIIPGVIIFSFKPLKLHFADLFPSQATKEEAQAVGKVSGVNPRVEEIQKMLKDLKFYTGLINGKIDEELRNALTAFQKKNNIEATSKADLKTLKSLRKQTGSQPKGNNLPAQKKDVLPNSNNSKISYDIKKIQTLLRNAGFYKGAIDDKMGVGTIRAIKEFQRSKNLKDSGVINIKTWEELRKFETRR